ncbi:unnamed protein product [Lathyrus sativus]|nr:unnamed protein product [Lathyrus sativus]
MGSRKKPAKKIEPEEVAAAIGSTSSIAAISDDDEEANKDLSLEIIHKALLNRATNPQNAAALNESTLMAPLKAHSEENKLRIKKRKKKKLESDIETVNTVKVEEKEKHAVETINAPEKVETSMVDWSDNDVLRNTTSTSHNEEIKTEKKKKKKKKRHESEIQTVNAVMVEEEEKKAVETIEDLEKGEPGAETINTPEKVKHIEVETCMVDTSESDVLRNTTSKLHSEESQTQKKKKKNHESEIQTVNDVIVEEEKKAVETIEDLQKVEPVVAEPEVVDTSSNIVLRKLLRGPRYFDPPSDNVWGICFNCGEEGHATFNCTAAKRKKPCFICGSLSHNVKKCTMARYCSTCKIVGHRTKDCPKKHSGGSYSKSLTVCLRCGNSGHDMLFCKNDYPEEDLKEIQCYVCKEFGHLCCVDTTEAIPKEFSCYRCGKMGHVGWACSRLKNEATDAARSSSCYTCGEKGHFARECSSSVKASSRWQPEITDPATPSSCYRCGEEGHFARECSSSVKASNRKHKFSSTETPRSQKENDYMGYTSEPYTEGSDIKTPKKSKHRGGWMSDHPSEFTPSNSKRDSWRSPVTPCTNNNSTPNHFVNNGSHNLGSKSFTQNFYDGTPNSEGSSARTFHHGHSASRFGNSNSNGFQRSYNGW